MGVKTLSDGAYLWTDLFFVNDRAIIITVSRMTGLKSFLCQYVKLSENRIRGGLCSPPFLLQPYDLQTVTC